MISKDRGGAAMNLTFRSPKTVVKESPIHGKGLFADASIAAGEIVAVKGGHIVGKQEWDELEKELGPAEMQVTEDLFIAPVRQDHRDGSMLYLNHSCDPNIGPQGQIVFAAMRDIAVGEELTHTIGPRPTTSTTKWTAPAALKTAAVRSRARIG